MAAKLFEQFESNTIEVDWMPGQDPPHIFPEWQCVPTNGVVHGQDITLVQACYLQDVTMIVIPTALAAYL